MDRHTFRNYIGLNDGYGGTDFYRAGQLVNSLAASGAEGVTRYSIGINGLGDGSSNIIPGTEVYYLNVDHYPSGGDSDWSSIAQGSLATGELFRNLKSYQFTGADAKTATDILDDKKFLQNGRIYKNRYFGNQH